MRGYPHLPEHDNVRSGHPDLLGRSIVHRRNYMPRQSDLPRLEYMHRTNDLQCHDNLPGKCDMSGGPCYLPGRGNLPDTANM